MRAFWGAMIAGVLGGAAANAFAGSFSCPPSVLDKGAIVKPDGAVEPPWARHALHNVALYDGRPDPRVELSPQEELKADRLIQIWDLIPGPGNRLTGAPITAVCTYRGTKAKFTAVLPAGLKRCTLVALKEGAVPPTITCE